MRPSPVASGPVEGLPSARCRRERALSPIEEGLLFPEFFGTVACYVEQVICDVSGPLDYARMELAIARLVQHHEILRTIYRKARGGLRARFLRSWKVSINRIDLSDHPDPRLAAERLIGAEARRTFDVTRTLSACSLYRLADGEHVFSWTYHHVLADSWTLRFLQDQFCSLYANPDAADLGPCAAYSDYAQWVTSSDSGPLLQNWRSYLAGVPARRSAASKQAGNGGERREAIIRLTGTALDDLELARQRYRVTANVVLMAMWGLATMTAERTSIGLLGCVVFGRGLPVKNIGSIAGVCANVVPVRFESDCTLESMLKRLQRDLLLANGKSHLALGDVLASAGLTRDELSSVVNFTFDRSQLKTAQAQGIGFKMRNIRYVQASDYDAYLDIELAADAIVITSNFSLARRRIDADEMGRTCSEILRLLANPQSPDVASLLKAVAVNQLNLSAEFDWLTAAGQP